jgi:hypothetical protein
MSKRDKLIQRFLSKPADFSWSELKSLLEGLGYQQTSSGKTGGSRVKFFHPEKPPIILHKPHPAPLLKRYLIEQITEFLKKEGFL